MRPSASTVLAWTGATCVYGCPACPIERTTAPPGLDAATLAGALLALPDRRRLVVLAGGDPLLRPDVLRLLRAIAASHHLPGLVTTGRALHYPQVREKLRGAGLAYLRVQLFGAGSEHDEATGIAGAYAHTIASLRGWLTDGGACATDIAVHPASAIADEVARTVEAIAADLGPVEAADLNLVVASNRQALAPSEAPSLLRAWNNAAERPALFWEGLRESDSPATQAAIPRLASGFLAAAPAASCLGTVRPANRAAGELPVRANSFNFVRTADSVAASPTAQHCRAHGALDAAQRDRHLWLVEGDVATLFATDTGDFDDADFRRIKNEWSHLFVDRAKPGVLDDFREGMRRVLPDPLCNPCDHRDVCARRFNQVEGPPFRVEEKWIADYVADLRGDVLDVGCGEQLYRDQIVPLVRSGALSYTGLDPDQPSLDEWSRLLPAGRFVLGGIEDFTAPPESYDRVLCLRSLNHVTDLDEAIARMAALLKPDGQLLIVETTPFAMLRQPEQVAAADRAPRAGHQHYRNVTGHDVLPYARRRRLRIVHHHPVGLATTNEWILLLAK